MDKAVSQKKPHLTFHKVQGIVAVNIIKLKLIGQIDIL